MKQNDDLKQYAQALHFELEDADVEILKVELDELDKKWIKSVRLRGLNRLSR